MGKAELNKKNLKVLFGKPRVTKKERKMYNDLISDNTITASEMNKYFPIRTRFRHKKSKKVKGRVYE